MTPGTRVRFNDRSAWPERIGAVGVVVAPSADGTYPQPARWEVLVLLDHDPHPHGVAADDHRRGWTCVTTRKAVDVI